MKKKPVVLIVMDGIGLSEKTDGNAVRNAYTPILDKMWATCPHTAIAAHGVAVGLPTDGDMGNSEVGHNALGCGQIYSQGAKLVNESIASNEIYQSEIWTSLVENAKGHTLHFIGLLSDGNVHSHISHLIAMITQAKKEGLSKVRVHALLDGRDVGPRTGEIYVKQLEDAMAELNDSTFNARIASGGGRMVVTMDRYEANWQMVEEGWRIHVEGKGRQFANATEAIETYRKELDLDDQYLPGFVIAEDGKPVGTIDDHDSVILFNFRGDRALEISRAFDNKDLPYIKRDKYPSVIFAGMLEYDGDLHIPNNYLVNPPQIEHTLSELLVNEKINSYAVSETQKFGHMTYFWNGNRSEKFDEDLEVWEEVKSDIVPFDQRPWMKAAEITDLLIEAMKSGKYQFLRANYPNGDMVGHTGDYAATIVGVSAVDLALTRVLKVADEMDYTVIITADHGNADEMYQKRKSPDAPIVPLTAHTLNKVPFIVYNNDVEIKEGTFGLSNVASTIVKLLGLKPHEKWNESIIR
ncbi:MAG: 2,3-bisphosphoglycerate-independent phosphoglycerate mutase [Bacillota bacterium]|jgi:2,3-bisphosphoglycerate-independent phosphoglycerate mutase|nr:2,3-bisphosphoglycerate-independent phosphoglycerate mutase [Bacillota bacterium]NLL26474.1 2,3-bisphosphoglycerate-independent phosphoglycerate mutase [Erysipelotrichia bacterium]